MTDTIQDIREAFIALKHDLPHAEIGGTIELIGSSFIADQPAIFGEPNDDYIKRELDWYMSMSLNVHDIPGGPPTIWRQVADPNGYVNSNYGYLMFSPSNGNQYANVLDQLVRNPDTRQAVAIYTRPTIHRESTFGGMHDFICTNAVHYYVRDGRLCSVVQMRSNDVIFGYRNDWAWQQCVVDKLVWDLSHRGIDVVKGMMTWQASSLHVYARHYDLIQES